jgi:hypothetical protein
MRRSQATGTGGRWGLRSGSEEGIHRHLSGAVPSLALAMASRACVSVNVTERETTIRGEEELAVFLPPSPSMKL